MHKKSFRLFLLMILVGGLILGVELGQQFQDIRGRAMELTSIPGQNVPKKLAVAAAPSTNVVYSSAKYGYSIQVDKSDWQLPSDPPAGSITSPVLAFQLHSGVGKAEVTLRAHDEKEFLSLVPQRKSVLGVDDLDTIAVALKNVKGPNIPPTATLTKSERIIKNGTEVYKLTYEQQFLQTKLAFYEYVFLANGKYYEVTTKYIPIGVSEDLAEQLVNSITFSSNGRDVKAAETTAMNNTKLDETKITELTNPSVVNIVNVTCAKIRLTEQKEYKYVKPSYGGFCTGGKGSGFIFTKDGYIATNGHVAKFFPEQTFLSALLIAKFSDDDSSSLQDFLVDLYREEYESHYQEQVSFDDAQQTMKTFSGLYWGFSTIKTLLLDHKMVAEDEKQKYFVKLGNDPITVDEKKLKKGDYYTAFSGSQNVKEASLVAYDFPDNYTFDTIMNNKLPKSGADVAIIKQKNDENYEYPNLQLEDMKKVKVGNSIVIIGYPGLVEGTATASSLLSFKSSANATITKGIVSSIKTDQDGRELLQTDASIDHGNSGGPAIDNQGNVIGIATYAIDSTSGQYNLLRSNTELRDLMKKNNIKVTDSAVYAAWDEGLNDFWNGYYRKSVPLFEKVKKAYPIHPTINSYISDAKGAIVRGEDKEGAWGDIRDRIPGALLFGIPTIILLTGVGGAIFIFIKRKKHAALLQAQANNMQQLMNQHIPIT